MKYLFPFICFVYACIFYMFFHFGGDFTQSIFPNTLYNSGVFIIFGIVFLLFFSDIGKNFIKKNDRKIIKQKKDKEYYKQYIKSLFLSYSHYLSYIFFYIGAFIVVKFLPGVYFSYCLLAINIFVIFFFLGFRNLPFSQDFLRINQIIFSLIYIGSYIYILFTKNNFFGFIDFVNSFIIILSFLCILTLSPGLKKDTFFTGNFYMYVYAFLMFYLSFIFIDVYLYLVIANIFLSLGIITLSQIISERNIDTRSLRLFGVILGYIGCIAGTLYLLQFSYNLYIYIALILGIISNFLFHIRYQNYVSYFFSLFTFSILLFIPSFGNIDGAYNFIFVLFFSYFLVAITLSSTEHHPYDSFFLHFMSYVYNFVGLILFFIFYNPSLLQVALLMFVEFLYFFGSYYKLNSQKSLLKTTKNIE